MHTTNPSPVLTHSFISSIRYLIVYSLIFLALCMSCSDYLDCRFSLSLSLSLSLSPLSLCLSICPSLYAYTQVHTRTGDLGRQQETYRERRRYCIRRYVHCTLHMYIRGAWWKRSSVVHVEEFVIDENRVLSLVYNRASASHVALHMSYKASHVM